MGAALHHMVRSSPDCCLCRLMPLSALGALTACKLQHCAGIRKPSDLRGLTALTALSSLDLCGCHGLHGSSISSLAALTCLR